VVTTQAEKETSIYGARLKSEMSSWRVRVLVRDGAGVSGIPGMVVLASVVVVVSTLWVRNEDYFLVPAPRAPLRATDEPG
jgi:hypothetical protein